MESSVANTARVMLTPAQLRAARALLDWSQEDLARELGGERHLSTIKRFESGKSDPKQSTLLAWRRALSKAGVVFIDAEGGNGPGVKLRTADS
jgi:transcriptional regulator with XRE-family HTH domain